MADNSTGNADSRQESILNASVSDQATESDSLGFEPYVSAIAEFLTNPVTQPPLTISIEGAWGSGKSSFMKQLQKAIEESQQKKFEKKLQNNLGKFDRNARANIKNFRKRLEQRFYNTFKIRLTSRLGDIFEFISIKGLFVLTTIYKYLYLNFNKLKPKPKTVWFNAWRHDKAEALWAAFALEFLRQISTSRYSSDSLNIGIGHVKLFLSRFNLKEGWLDFIRTLAQLGIGISAIVIIGILSFLKGPAWVDELSKGVKNLNIRLEQTNKTQERNSSSQSKNSIKERKNDTSSHQNNNSNQKHPTNQDRTENSLPENPYSIPIGAASIGGSTLAVISLWQQLRKLVGDPKKALIKYLQAPNYKNQVSFVEKFHEDFKKIVDAYAGKNNKVYVFIDDLDRCELPKSADLMQALNLMISNDPHIIFILGMDREKVAAGLAVKYKDILPYLPSSSIAPNTDNQDTRSSFLSGIEYGYAFLEKFIQIPFQVPQPAESDFKRFLSTIALPIQQKQKPSFLKSVYNNISTLFRKLNHKQQPEQASQGESSTEKSQTTEKKDREEHREKIKLDVTEDSKTVRNIVLMVAPALDYNPRRLKQFINLFRLKTYIASNTGLFDEIVKQSQESSINQPLTLEQLGKFTAINVKWPRLLADLDVDRKLLTNLQKRALNTADFDFSQCNEITKDWADKPKLLELLRCYPGIISSALPDEYILEDKYSLEKVDVNKLLQVSPGTQDDLSSERGVDYTKLRDLLAARNWKEADRETHKVMLQAVGRSENDFILIDELSNFPCTDLHTIDRLWVKYSNGRFGFSVQKNIYLEVGGKLNAEQTEESIDEEIENRLKAHNDFCDRVGWREESSLATSNCDTADPIGHLPTLILTYYPRTYRITLRDITSDSASYITLFSRYQKL
ncbi:MAG: GUN4 domain-containing protein [Aulosira sp. ZfuVER01]|nr:GUN4 domain-containing protein [Aulosira sp. ZfuVER01]MDZ7996635.1 GUN4 domain-containing protein [Aulosira sp. DedVER01a]MDZ8053862.1 GUN4 domain-containing protein [Aulosira sp. ZfuCHP01]